jgi:predicted PilT family ATPase
LIFFHQASYFIFEKMKLEGFAGADGDVRLRTLISIPQSSAGRVVGRSGKNVREIQRSTGAVITLPSADTTHSSEQTEANTDIVPQPPSGEVTVEVYGNFIATQVNHILYYFQLFDAQRYKIYLLVLGSQLGLPNV